MRLRAGDRIVILGDGKPHRRAHDQTPYVFRAFPHYDLRRYRRLGWAPNSVVRITKLRRA